MAQTKTSSLVETLVNVSVGYVIAILSQMVLFPMFGMEISLVDNLIMGGFFTVISIIRGYALRRAFNWISLRSSK